MYQPKSQTFTVIFKTAAIYSKHAYSTYHVALLDSLVFYVPLDILQAAAERALTRDGMRIRNLRAVNFAAEKERRGDF